MLGVDAPELAVRRDDLRGQQAVDREAVLADEVAHAASERDPPDPHRTRVAEPDPQTVSVGRGGELERGQARLRPRRALLGVHVDRAQFREVDHDPAVGHALSDHAVAAALHGELEPGLARERDHAGDVHLVGDPDDHRGVQVEPAVEDGAGPVVLGVVGSDHRPPHVGPELGDRDAGRGGHRWPPSWVLPVRPRCEARTHRSRSVHAPASVATQVGFPSSRRPTPAGE